MGFYSGRAGRDFAIEKVFSTIAEMEEEARSTASDWTESAVPINGFVLVISDQALKEENAAIYIKQSKDVDTYYYTKVGHIASILPEIENGYWSLGGVQTKHLAVARSVQFRIKQYEKPSDYMFVSRIKKDGLFEYGLCDLDERYIWNEALNGYELSSNGTFVKVIKAQSNGDKILDEFGAIQYYQDEKGNIAYFDINDDTWGFNINLRMKFTDTWVEQKYDTDLDIEENWKKVFEVSDLVNISNYTDEALRASSISAVNKEATESLLEEAKNIQKSIEEDIEDTKIRLNEAEGYSKAAITAAEDVHSALEAFRQDIENNPNADPLLSSLNKEIIEARQKFPTFGRRLNLMPYQFDTIADMIIEEKLSRGDKAFTFGMDNLGDGDSSKLFQIFNPNDPEDKKRLEEIVEGTQTEDNPEGELKIAEQYPLANGLIAGLLAIFSGYGSGGGGGGSAVPSISVTGSDTGFSVKEGEVITLEYYWTGPTAGTATLFIKDTKDSKVVDYFDNSKVYSTGVPITRFGAGSVTLKPSKGEHTYTFYIIDRAQAYSNEVKVKVVAGSMSLIVDLSDGQTFSATSAITYNFTVNTIYSKHSVLNYTITQNGQLYDMGEIVSSSATMGIQSIRLPVKQATENIGQGQFKITAYAYVQDDPSTVTNTITRNFVIMENNIIYLTTSFDGDATLGYQGEPLSIPLQLIYVGGSDFIIEGRYGETSDFDWETGIPTVPSMAELNRAGAFTYPVTFQNVGTYYIKFKASSNAVSAIGYSETIKVNIEEKISKYPLQREDALIIHYNAKKGQTNSTSKYVWENMSSQNASDDATLVGFNYSSNGWETEVVNGIEAPSGYLHCSGKSYVSIPYDFYQSITQNSGATLEIVFKAVDIGSEQTIFSMTYAENAGFFIYKDKAVLNMPSWGINNLIAYYNINGVNKEDAPCHITLTIDPENKYVKIFANGVIARANAELNFNVINNATRTYINRGLSNADPQYGVTKVDCVRMYKTCLTDAQVLRNYVYNLRDELKQAELWTKNYLDSDSDNQFPEKIPYMTFFINKDDWARMDKDNHKPKIRVTYHDPNPPEGNKTDYTWDKVQTAWQGTSSIAYPVKNFKIKLPEKYKLKGDKYSLKEKTFCLKADYMDSSHCHNTGTANFIHSTGLLSNYALTPAQSKELNISVAQGYKGLNNLPATDLDGDELIKPKPVELKTRTCIDGHPIALYICLETDESAADENRTPDEREYENPLYWGIYNFNLDKGSTDSFGLTREDDDFQNVTSFEIAANSAYSGGGFRALRFIKKIDAEEYGWTRWNVGFIKDDSGSYSANLEQGNYLNITKALANGEIVQGTRQISFTYHIDNKDKVFTGVYNENLNNIKGVAALEDKYTSTGVLDPNGTYIKIYQYDEINNTLYIDPDTNTTVVLSYENYNVSGWSFDVPFDSVIYELKDQWELYGEYGIATEKLLPKNAIKLSHANANNEFEYIVLKNPENIDAKYDYYESDFELRYPDADIFLTNQDKPNKLYWKEYDKIIALVEWVDYIGIDKANHFTNGLKEHFDQDTLINYYLTLMTTGMIDNFGKNLMIDTWGYDKNGKVPYQLFKDKNGNIYHKVWKFISQWDEDEEYYLDNGTYQYGLMDINNPIETEDGIKYNVYSTNENYSILGELIEKAEFGGTVDDRITGWYHEIDISQIVWYTHFYDLDSSLGVNNSGILSFGPSIEMNDNFYINMENQRIPNAPFNTSNSALWQQLVINFDSAINNRFTDLSKSIYSLETFKKYYYNDIIDIMGERMYNADSIPKYLSREDIKIITGGQIQYVKPYTYDHLALGNDWQRISKWLGRRINYLTYMYLKDLRETTGTFELRTESPEKAYTLQIECYEPCYMRFLYRNNVGEYKRVTGFNEIITITTPVAAGATDQEVYIDPPSNVKSFKEISNPKLGFSTVKIADGSKLLELDLGNSQGLTELTMPSQVSLTKNINLSNCPNLGGSLSGDNFPYLEYINTMGTNIIFNFNSTGGAIETALLEATGTELKIIDHSDLKNLTLQFTYEEPPNENRVHLGHNCNYSSITLDNCSDPAFSLNIKGRYKDPNVLNKDNWIEVPTQLYEKFINNYGIFSLFSKVKNLTIRNSLNPIDSEQLQPNGETLQVKEFTVSLPLLKRLELIKTKFDKIALVSSSMTHDGQTVYTGYPGWGGNPEVTVANGVYTFTGDSNYIAEKAEGIIGDDSIKELEFRGPYLSDKLPSNSLPTAGKFEFPWRVYLGTMPKLQRLKFNTISISPKKITYDANGVDGDQYYLTRPISNNNNVWIPNRFELILPEPPKPNMITDDYRGLEMIYFGPSVSNIDFTAIRQKDTNLGEYYIEDNSAAIKTAYNWPKEYFETIRSGNSNTLIGEIYFHPFRGVDLKGYSDLVMNFHSLNNIIGIVGMNALNIKGIKENFGEKAFSGFFENCKKLQFFHFADKIENEIIGKKPNIYKYNKWDFSNWFSPTLSDNFKDISRMFKGCISLSDTSYLKGILNPTNSQGFKVENAEAMFEECNSLMQVDIQWQNIFSTVNNIKGMFQNCLNLELANIFISGIDVEKEDYLKSLKRLFAGCVKLKEQSIILLTDAQPVENAFKYIEDVSEMYSNCESLISIDYSLTFDDIDIDSNEINVFNFNNLKYATGWFKGCKSLAEIKFPLIINFTKLEDMSMAFQDCESLNSIFIDSKIELYDEIKSTKDLVLTQLLANCKKLTSIGGLADADMTRAVSIEGLFTNNTGLIGKLDLSKWNFDIVENKANRYVNTKGLFSGCSNLTEIILPKIYTNNLTNMFFGCNNLVALDVSPVIPERQMLTNGTRIGPTDFSSVFAGCNKLTNATFKGYENWNTAYGTKFSGMFGNCARLESLDLRNWKIVKSENAVSIDLMFRGCSALKNIYGLNSLFGTFEDVLSRTKGAYNEQFFTSGGVVGLFDGCQNLLLGQNDNNLAAWARMAVKISSMNEMFQTCSQLTNLKLVFARGTTNPSTGEVTIPGGEILYWGSDEHSGAMTESNINCKFEALSTFVNMCANCKSLTHFDYFGDSHISYADNALYQYPTNLSSTTLGCSNLVNFAFTPIGAAMHNLTADLTTTFNGCEKMTSITFPSRTNKNLGIKKNMTIIGGLTENDWNNLAPNILTWVYDFEGNNYLPDENAKEGKLTLSKAVKDYEIMAKDGEFRQGMSALGWNVVIPQN